MNRILEIGTKIKDPDDLSGEYTIEGVIGSGTTCVVYLAKSKSKEGIPNKHILKEYNPRTIALVRGEDNSLNVRNEKDRRAFSDGMNRFKAGITKQAEVRLHTESMNSTSIIARDFAANQTHYAVMPLMAGETYDKVTETSLYNLLRRICAITKAVKSYHDQGLLHLDIKPENIFTLPETVELVQMFDFDSVIEKDKVISAPTMSYTQNWAAQEQILPYGRKRICEATDLFAIGEILFYKLMGRHSVSSERYSYATYHFDPATELLRDADPKVFELLSEIFEHTICNVVARRWQSADILLGKLEEAIKKSYPEKHRLLCNLTCEPEFFVGRDSELSEIDNRLKQTDKLFITGMGGIGKSELCKKYAHMHKDEYDAVIFAVCNTDLESMILDDSALPIAKMQMIDGEKAEDYIKRKYAVLESLCTERILLIVDNLNNVGDDYLNKFLKLNCKMLITTRCDVGGRNYPHLSIGALKDATKLFNHWYPQESPSAEESAAVEQILKMYAGHTLAIELIAKQMDSSDISPQEMLKRLTGGGFRKSGKEPIVRIDGDNYNANDHIRHLFDVSGLSDNQIYILANLSLIPVSGVSTKQFKDLCKLEDNIGINSLVQSGWARKDAQSRFVSLHPVIADIALEKVVEKPCLCEAMLKTIIEIIQKDDFGKTNAQARSILASLAMFICKRLYVFDMPQEFIIDFIEATVSTFYLYDNISTCVIYMEKAICDYRQICKSDTTAEIKEANLYNTIAILFQKNMEYQSAEKYYLMVKDIAEKVYKRPRRFTATCYNNLGTLYSEWGKLDEALNHHRKALDIRLEVCGNKHEHTAISYNNIGKVFWRLEKYADAKTNFLNALDIWRGLYGEEHTHIAIAYSNLGSVNESLGDMYSAEKYYCDALSLRLKLLGELHEDTANSYGSIGLLYYKLGRYEEAIDQYNTALKIRLKLHGETHPSVQLVHQRIQELKNKQESSKH